MAFIKNFSKICNGGARSDEGLILIDGECVLCNRTAQFVIRHDPKGRFRFAALQSKRARHELDLHGLPEPPPGTFVLIQNGAAFYRSDAALRVVGMLSFPWCLARVFFIVPRFFRDFFYEIISRSRYRAFGRTAFCGLLTPSERARFLNDADIPEI